MYEWEFLSFRPFLFADGASSQTSRATPSARRSAGRCADDGERRMGRAGRAAQEELVDTDAPLVHVTARREQRVELG